MLPGCTLVCGPLPSDSQNATFSTLVFLLEGVAMSASRHILPRFDGLPSGRCQTPSACRRRTWRRFDTSLHGDLGELRADRGGYDWSQDCECALKGLERASEPQCRSELLLD